MLGYLFLTLFLIFTTVAVIKIRQQAVAGTLLEDAGSWGIRTRATTSSQEAWEYSHRAADALLRVSIFSGLVSLGLLAVLWIGTGFSGGRVFDILMPLPAGGYFLQVCVFIAAQVKAHRAASEISEENNSVHPPA